ncbi:MAG TPA: phosphotransferase [Bryobacteraceae bacterium]|nr:phosphotransferase [Bryobacteraceae bacterium]HXJ41911.1 phosphotransferase [Bryobacteraceae bacterium]
MIRTSPVIDEGIPTLPAVLDPLELGKRIAFFSFPPWDWGRLRDVRIQKLKLHHGSRCTVQINLRTDGGPRAVIGKVYASGGLEVYQSMTRISQSGFGPEAEFSIPQPLAFVPELHLLVQELVPGPLAQDFFRGGDERDYAVASTRCGHWLVRFHSIAPRIGPVFDLSDYLISLERWSRRIAECSETLAGKAICLFRRLEDRASALKPAVTCAGHGSFCHSQIILAHGRTTTFDWDGCDVADPSRDVARFMVSLKRLALGCFGSIRALDSAARIFLRTYTDAGGPEALSCLPFFQAATCIKLAKYEISKGLDHRRQSIMESMLDEGLQLLEDGN